MTTIPLRRVARTVNGAGFPHEHQGTEFGDLPFFKVGDFASPGNERYLKSCKNWVDATVAKSLGASPVPPGSILLPKVGAALLGNARRICTTWSVFDNNVLAVVPNNVDSRFLHYWLSTIDLGEFANPGPVPSINEGPVRELLMPEIGIGAGKPLADYLDVETARVDELISKKVQLASALNAHRQAVIDERVESASLSQLLTNRRSLTQERIPSGWSITRLDHEATVRARIGWKALTASEYVDDGYAFLSTTNLRGASIDFDNVNFITEYRWLESPELQLHEGDVLMTKDGAGIGWTAVVRSVPRPSTVNGSIAVIRPKSINGRFLFYALSSDAIQTLVGAFKSGMGVPHLFQADLKKFPILKPSLPDQIEIANYLDQETSRTDAAIVAIEHSISLLRERRKALVTTVVTGQMEIPEGANGNQ